MRKSDTQADWERDREAERQNGTGRMRQAVRVAEQVGGGGHDEVARGQRRGHRGLGTTRRKLPREKVSSASFMISPFLLEAK